MKTILLLSCALLLAACEPARLSDGGLDAADVQATTDAGSEASSDALPPHVDGGGID